MKYSKTSLIQTPLVWTFFNPDSHSERKNSKTLARLRPLSTTYIAVIGFLGFPICVDNNLTNPIMGKQYVAGQIFSLIWTFIKPYNLDPQSVRINRVLLHV